jgi:hypothetical protein
MVHWGMYIVHGAMLNSETWMKSCYPDSVTRDIAPDGYHVIHCFREHDAQCSAVALIHDEDLQATKVPMSTSLQHTPVPLVNKTLTIF